MNTHQDSYLHYEELPRTRQEEGIHPPVRLDTLLLERMKAFQQRRQHLKRRRPIKRGQR